MRRLYDLFLWLMGLPKPQYWVLLGSGRALGPFSTRYAASVALDVERSVNHEVGEVIVS